MWSVPEGWIPESMRMERVIVLVSLSLSQPAKENDKDKENEKEISRGGVG
jgi:hypothetical protein